MKRIVRVDVLKCGGSCFGALVIICEASLLRRIVGFTAERAMRQAGSNAQGRWFCTWLPQRAEG